MKKIGLFVMVIIASVTAYATIITAITNGGDWNTSSTWDAGRPPQSGDTVVIPAGYIVNINSNYSYTGLFIVVYGTLNFNQNGKLNLYGTTNPYQPANIQIMTGGQTTSATSNSSDQVKIFLNGTMYSHLSGNQLNINHDTLIGPPVPQPSPLPVLFASFSLVHSRSNVLIQWSTAFESNSKIFEIDRSTNGRTWTTIGTVTAAGNSSIPLSYSYTDQNVSGSTTFYYRVKEVDLDGHLIYTNIKSIKLDYNSPDIKIVYVSKNNLYVNFSQQVKGNVLMRLVSSSGQLIFHQTITNPIGQVNITARNHSAGFYILSISDGKGLSISKQVLF